MPSDQSAELHVRSVIVLARPLRALAPAACSLTVLAAGIGVFLCPLGKHMYFFYWCILAADA